MRTSKAESFLIKYENAMRDEISREFIQQSGRHILTMACGKIELYNGYYTGNKMIESNVVFTDLVNSFLDHADDPDEVLRFANKLKRIAENCAEYANKWSASPAYKKFIAEKA